MLLLLVDMFQLTLVGRLDLELLRLLITLEIFQRIKELQVLFLSLLVLLVTLKLLVVF